MHISKQKAGGIAVAIAVVSFIIGAYSGVGSGSATSNVTQGMRGGATTGRAGGAPGGMRGGAQAGFVNGEVVSLDATSLTVKMRDGSSKIVFYGKDSVSVQKSVAGALSDVATGSNVMIMGKPNPDGSVTAESIQIRPAGSDRGRQ